MPIEYRILHPAHGDTDTFLIFLFVIEGHRLDLITQIETPHTEYLFTRGDGI